MPFLPWIAAAVVLILLLTIWAVNHRKVGSVLAQLPTLVESLTGVDLNDLLARAKRKDGGEEGR